MSQFVSSIEGKYRRENNINNNVKETSAYGESLQKKAKRSRLEYATIEGYVDPCKASNPLLSYLTGDLNPSESNVSIESPGGGQIGQWVRIEQKVEERDIKKNKEEEESFKLEEKPYVVKESEIKGVTFKKKKKIEALKK
jgi:hypothetical protein